MRAPYQVLILPFRRTQRGVEFAVFKRSGTSCWQFVSGGGEDDERPVEAAVREMQEEVGVNVKGRLVSLDAKTTIPVNVFKDSANWDDALLVIPEHAFASDIDDAELVLSSEHDELKWVTAEQANSLLRWDSNKTALWEVCQRLVRGMDEQA